MEIVSLSALAISIATPFISKTAEGVARKVGEDIWSLIKAPFVKKGKEDIEQYAKNDPENFKRELECELENDDNFRICLQEKVDKATVELSGSFQQNINNTGTIEKQVNIQNNSGNLNF